MSKWTSYFQGESAHRLAFGAVVTIVMLGCGLALLADPPEKRVSTMHVPAAVIGIGDVTDFVNESSTEFDDGWRKTANGWEHISTWEHPPIVVEKLIVLPPPDFREVTKYDLHPFAWTMLMVCLSIAALSFLPGSSPPEMA